MTSGLKSSFQMISKLSLLYNCTNEELFFLFKIIFSYEFVITSPRGYYCLEEGNMCCQENACSVLVFSSSNDGALPLRID